MCAQMALMSTMMKKMLKCQSQKRKVSEVCLQSKWVSVSVSVSEVEPAAGQPSHLAKEAWQLLHSQSKEAKRMPKPIAWLTNASKNAD